MAIVCNWPIGLWTQEQRAIWRRKFKISFQDKLEDTDKLIEVADRHHVTEKQKGQVRIKMCNNNGKPFIATLHNVLLAPDLCDNLFSFINVMIENNLPHKSGAKRTLYNVAMKGFPLLSHIFIHTWLFFSLMWYPFKTSMYLSVSSDDTGMKYETYGVMWHVAPEFKIQFINYELSS